MAGDFRRGIATVTYLGQPRRERVLAARTAVYAALGGLFGALVAACTSAVSVLVVHGEGLETNITTLEIGALIAAVGAAGALLSAAATLVGTAARNATVGSGAIVIWNLAEGLLHVAGVGPYLPFGLVNTLIGLEQGVDAVAAVGLLAAYVVLLALAVLRCAVRRDLT